MLSAVSLAEEGKASGVLDTIRQVGGVLGVAVLATVFSATVGYASPGAFVNGLTWALWVATATVGLGTVTALGIPNPTAAPTSRLATAGARAPAARRFPAAAGHMHSPAGRS